MNKDSFVFYRSFYDAIQNIPKDSQLELYSALFEYAFNGEEPEFSDGIAKALFVLIKPNIDSANARYQANYENGKKGGRPKEKPEENPKKTQTKPKENPNKTESKAKPNLNVDVDVDEDVDVNVDVNVNEDVDVDKNTPKRKRFVAPTLEEIKSYCEQRKNNVDAKKFYDYFTASGWYDSKGNKVKSWKQKIITWEGYGGANRKEFTYDDSDEEGLSL